MKTLRKWFAANLAIFGTKCKHLTPTENIFKIVENFTKFWIMSAGCFSNVFMFFWHFFVERRTFSNFKQEASFENFQRKVMLPLAIHLKATRHYFWTWNKFMQIFSKIKNATRLDVYTVQKQCLYLNVFTKRSINFIPISLFSSSKIKYTKYKIQNTRLICRSEEKSALKLSLSHFARNSQRLLYAPKMVWWQFSIEPQ